MDKMDNIFTDYRNLNGSALDAVKTVMTNMQFAAISQDKELKSLTITSSIPNEGKSLISTFLSIALAENGKKVLLIDCDWRHPQIRKSMTMKKGRGVVGYFSGMYSFAEAVTPTEVRGLYILDCETKIPNPIEIINSENFSKLLSLAQESFDVVIVDTPPLNSFIDAALVAAKTDGTIVVVRSGVIDKKTIMGTIAQLEKANANVIGAVMNCVEKTAAPYYYYYKYYNHYNYEQQKK